MAPFYLKGVAPKHVRLEDIFAGVMPFIYIVVVCMLMVYAVPSITTFLPDYLYGGAQAPVGGSTLDVPQGGFSLEEDTIKPLN
jgi:hypothetical protein